MSQKIQIRRGTDAERATVTFDPGEPVWTTDTNSLYVGGGSTVGGIAIVTGGGGGGAVIPENIVFKTGDQLISGAKTFNEDVTCITSLYGPSTYSGPSIDIGTSELLDSAGVPVLNWGLLVLQESIGEEVTLDWEHRGLSGNWEVATSSVPANFNSAGVKGMMAADSTAGFLYVCTGVNAWGRVALSEW